MRRPTNINNKTGSYKKVTLNLIAHAPIDLNDVHIAVINIIHYSRREKSIKLGQQFKACVTISADFMSMGL